MSSASTWAFRPEPMDELKRRVDALLYLGTVEKIVAALAYQYGEDRKLPSRAFIQDKLDRNAARPFKRARL